MNSDDLGTDPQSIGPYRIIRRIGRGGMGVVYAARDERLGRVIAMKLLVGSAKSQVVADRFLREAQAGALIQHPNVCQVYDIGVWEGLPYIVMELLEGPTLATRIRQAVVPLEMVLRIGLEILDGLEAIHRCGLLHRDLTPSNVTLTEHGAKILDFGLVGFLDTPLPEGSRHVGMSRERLTVIGELMGTPSYMSPEQLQMRPLDECSDIFAMGAILHEMLTGRPAFLATSWEHLSRLLLHEMPTESGDAGPRSKLDPVVRRALAKSPQERYPSARAMAQALQEFHVPEIVSPVSETAVVMGPLAGQAQASDVVPPRRLNRYGLVRPLGSGATGTVWLAESLESGGGLRHGEAVALKILHPSLLASAGHFRRFLREAEVGRRVRHPNLVRVLDIDAALVGGRQLHYLVMEYVEGQTLRELLVELGRVPEALCRHIGTEIAKALHAIHSQGILHRDLKPENIQITRRNDVKVMDLGVAFLKEEANRLTRPQEFVGTIPYAAPEQLRGDPLDGRADLFATGVILFELVSGVHPFSKGDVAATLRAQMEDASSRVSTLCPQVSAFFEELIWTLLQKDRTQRFETAADLFAALQQGEDSTWWSHRSSKIRREPRQRPRPMHVNRESSLHGRAQELRTLEERFAKACRGEGQVILVDGEQGIGKSRLLDEFAATLTESDAPCAILYGAYPPGGLASAEEAFRAAFFEFLGPENLEARLLAYMPGMHPLIPDLACLLRGDPHPPGQDPISPMSLQVSFVQLAKQLAAEQPTLLVIDDLQYAPSQGMALFAAMARAMAGSRMLLAGITQPDEATNVPGLLAGVDQLTRMTLARLGAQDLQRLLQEVLQSDELADELGGRIALKSDGNPLFVLAVLQGLREAGAITPGPEGGWRRSSQITRLEIPSGIRDLIQARLLCLDEADRDVLEIAACIGFSFDPLLVAEALGVEKIPLLKRLGRLARTHRLVDAAGRNFVFDQHQIQDYLYEQLSDPLKEEYHGLVASALEKRTGGAATDRPVTGGIALSLCEHLFRARRVAEALHHVDAAVQHLERTGETMRSLDFTGLALAATEELSPEATVTLSLVRARVLNQTGQSAEAQETLERARCLAAEYGKPALRARVEGVLGDFHLSRWESEAAKGCFERQLAVAIEEEDRADQIRALNGLGSACVRMREGEHALEHHERAMALARETGDTRGEAKATEGVAASLAIVGRVDAARSYREQAITMFRAIGDSSSAATAITNLGFFHAKSGDFVKAGEYFADGAAVFRSLGNVVNEAVAAENLAKSQACLLRYDEASRRLERCLAIYRETGNRQKAGLVLAQLASYGCFLGEFPRARTWLAEALEIERELNQLHRVAEVLSGLGFVEDQDGHPDEALAFYAEAMSVCPEPDCQAAAEAACFRGRILLEQGDKEAAGKFLESDADVQTSPEVYMLFRSYRALLDVQHLPAALEAYAEHGARLESRWRMECFHVLWRASGDPQWLAAASGLLDDLCACIPADRRAGVVESVPLYRAISRDMRSRGDSDGR